MDNNPPRVNKKTDSKSKKDGKLRIRNVFRALEGAVFAVFLMQHIVMGTTQPMYLRTK